MAVNSTSFSIGRFGSSSIGRLSFFITRSMYSYTLLVLAVSYIIKNHYIQSDSLLRIILAFNLFMVIIFKFIGVKQGPIGGLAKTLF